MAKIALLLSFLCFSLFAGSFQDYVKFRLEANLKQSKLNPLDLKHSYVKEFLKNLAKRDVKLEQSSFWSPLDFNKQRSHYPIAFHVFKFDVVEDYDDFSDDDIYCYFFITNGVIPQGRVSALYTELDEGESFLFSSEDRILFPTHLSNDFVQDHIIIDYGVVESDGDDIAQMQKLSGIIVDLAYAYYSQGGEVATLRNEVKALLSLVATMDDDDRLTTGTISLSVDQINAKLKKKSYVEWHQYFEGSQGWSDWAYRLHFRMIRGDIK